jgi:hypothetical protein
MDQGPTNPSDDDPEWGQRRRGTPPPPRGSWDEVREEFEQAARDWEGGNWEAGGRESWTPPGAGGRGTPGAGPDLSSLFLLLDGLRRAAPVELQERVTTLVREILLTLRSLIDWYLERLDQPQAKPEVEDIPID